VLVAGCSFCLLVNRVLTSQCCWSQQENLAGKGVSPAAPLRCGVALWRLCGQKGCILVGCCVLPRVKTFAVNRSLYQQCLHCLRKESKNLLRFTASRVGLCSPKSLLGRER